MRRAAALALVRATAASAGLTTIWGGVSKASEANIVEKTVTVVPSSTTRAVVVETVTVVASPDTVEAAPQTSIKFVTVEATPSTTSSTREISTKLVTVVATPSTTSSSEKISTKFVTVVASPSTTATPPTETKTKFVTVQPSPSITSAEEVTQTVTVQPPQSDAPEKEVTRTVTVVASQSTTSWAEKTNPYAITLQPIPSGSKAGVVASKPAIDDGDYMTLGPAVQKGSKDQNSPRGDINVVPSHTSTPGAARVGTRSLSRAASAEETAWRSIVSSQRNSDGDDAGWQDRRALTGFAGDTESTRTPFFWENNDRTIEVLEPIATIGVSNGQGVTRSTTMDQVPSFDIFSINDGNLPAKRAPTAAGTASAIAEVTATSSAVATTFSTVTLPSRSG